MNDSVVVQEYVSMMGHYRAAKELADIEALIATRSALLSQLFVCTGAAGRLWRDDRWRAGPVLVVS